MKQRNCSFECEIDHEMISNNFSAGAQPQTKTKKEKKKQKIQCKKYERGPAFALGKEYS